MIKKRKQTPPPANSWLLVMVVWSNVKCATMVIHSEDGIEFDLCAHHSC
jgi:hypothetical protein